MGGAPPQDLSAINVKAYKKRFEEFMKDKVFNYDFNHRREISEIRRDHVEFSQTILEKGSSSRNTTDIQDNILYKKVPNQTIIEKGSNLEASQEP